MASDTVYGWHFLATDGKTAHRDPVHVKVGDVLTVKPPIIPCNHGLHGSLRLIDALYYAPGPILTRCAYSGEIVHETDKLAASRREILWMADVSAVLHLAACHFAETAMRVAKVTDPRSWAAIEAKRKWLRGEITDLELDAANAAAWDAAGDAASAAAWDAARDAANAAAWDAAGDAASAAAWDAASATARDAARDAAWDAARDAANAAAWDATSAAERAAAWDATWDAAWAAARDAAWDAQNDWLECAVREFAGVDGTLIKEARRGK